MGTVNIHSKPEAETFKHAFAADAEGNLVKVSLDSIKKLLDYISSYDAAEIVSW